MDDDKLIEYLATHPDVLIRHQAALQEAGVIFPNSLPAKNQDTPHGDKRSDGKNVIDVTSKIASKARLEARHATMANQNLLNVAAQNMLHWQELHLATLGFLACNDLSGFAQMVHEELPLIFGLASSHLVMPNQTAIPRAESLGFLTLPEDEIAALIGTEVIMMGAPAAELLALIPDRPASMAVMRLPDQLPEPVASTLLVLGGRDPDSFSQDKGRALLLYLSEMVGVCLLSLIEASQGDSRHSEIS